jgi:hypothetical protein
MAQPRISRLSFTLFPPDVRFGIVQAGIDPDLPDALQDV